ncbi:putative Gamma-butyrobetaine hydroxylase subfamily [Aspergillus novofumigatus IBT 16806]|uniref:Putative gamma-butyrobetaine hydroxylase subfamily n=1 Tax=Aspergillus novofumigatus (strain IBT 16806) TaxID=1392255 RepID=A0A2I1CNW3_ASPN1|nr:putative gamma-butyrobetaine hydroxylase subfamily [Aspergillus novofumigatus IBT 16806]PKX99324.1 putative gamma-butyrobetaine hydroxylase subfamily [Aspergillus novofumigatus IBT 16806]
MSRIVRPLARLPWRRLKTDYLDLNRVISKHGYNDYAQEYLGKPAPEGIRLLKAKLDVMIDGEARGFRYMLLRDACKCNLCVDEHSKQRKFRTADISPVIVPRDVQWDGKKLRIKWSTDIEGWGPDHVSHYDVAMFKDHRANPPRSDTGTMRRRFLWDKKSMKESQYWVSYEDYMNDETAFVKSMRHLALMGIIFVKDIPDSREMVEKIATKMGPLRNTFYGPTWDVRSVPEAKNVAYTNVSLAPGFQLLHCLENSCDGAIADLVRWRQPERFEDLTKLHLNYEYNHKEHIYNNSWPVLETEDGDPKSRIVHVNYSPPFQAPIISDEHIHKHWSEYRRALVAFASEIERPYNVFQLKLNPGECVIFENRRVLHARNQFNTEQGNRWLAGAYVDEDAVLSTFRKCRNAQYHTWHWTRVLGPRKAPRAAGEGEATAEDHGTE